jgi:hypothetical protein
MKKKDIWRAENFFYLHSDISRINKIICHYEIFQLTQRVPGDIVELGVFKGNSLIRFLSFRDLIKLKKKRVIGFDAFGNFPKQTIKEDNKFAKDHDKFIGKGYSIAKIEQSLKNKKIKNFKLVKGNIMKTLPDFLKRIKKFKISFLHLDLDVYEPTKFVLNKLYNRVSKNGVILIDDYGEIKGATKATNEFLRMNKKLKIKTLKFDKRLKFIIKK